MTGFILGTGGGILAAAAVYYTLSTDLQRQTESLRHDLRNSSTTLSSSFDPQSPPPAPVSLIGPSHPVKPRFSETLRSRWNLAIAQTFNGIRETDWTATGTAIIDSTATLTKSLSGPVVEKAETIEHRLEDFAGKVKKTAEEIVDKVEAAKDGHVVGGVDGGLVGMGVVGADVRGESLTGGPVAYVKAKRTAEGSTGRLV